MNIEEITRGLYPACALLAGMQLDVFTPLDAQPQTAVELAAALEVDAERLETLLYALVAAGLLVVRDGRFANGEEARERLVHGRVEFVGDRHLFLAHCFAAALQTADSVRAGEPAARINYAECTDDELEALLRGLHPGAKRVGAELAVALDLEVGATVLDVGGGTGGLALGMVEARPGVAATVAELPQVAPIARRVIGEEGQTDCITVVECDVCAEELAGPYDLAVLKAFVQVLAPAVAQAALARVYRALAPGGRLVVYGDMVADTRTEPADLAVMGLFFLAAYESGRPYTEGEYRAWLKAAGFVRIEELEQGVLVAYKEDK